jgi:hypothetical protein
MKIDEIKVGDVLVPRRWREDDSSDLVFLDAMGEFCDKPQVVREVDRWDDTISFEGCIVEGLHAWWPVSFVERVRSSPGQRLARVQAAVGRLAATASGPDRLMQLQRRMVRATKAAADLVVEEVAKMEES